jgi:type II secretory pathway pseudopilin PulG
MYWTSWVMNTRWSNSQTRRSGGFTLIEASLTTIIIGVGVMAMLQLLAAGTVNNIQAFEMTTAANVGKAIREVTVQKSLAQIIAMNGTYHEPPWDSRSQPMNDLPHWRQTITVQAVDPNKLTLNITDPSPSAVRVSVAVSHNGQPVTTLSWYTFAATP